jgi:hypothetical protein
LHAVSATLLTATVSFSPADRDAAWKSITCHWSQATQEEQAQNRAALDYLWQGMITFQQWGRGSRRTSLL